MQEVKRKEDAAARGTLHCPFSFKRRDLVGKFFGVFRSSVGIHQIRCVSHGNCRALYVFIALQINQISFVSAFSFPFLSEGVFRLL